MYVCVCVTEEKTYNFVIFIIFKRNPELRIFFISLILNHIYITTIEFKKTAHESIWHKHLFSKKKSK